MNKVDIRLYAILDPEHTLGRSLPELASAAASSGITLLQYRDKRSSTRQMIINAREIKNAVEGYAVPLIINDRADVTLASGAAGLHLGQDDMTIEDARHLLGPTAIIGQSIKTEADANRAPVEVLDYAFIGGVFETASKNNPTSVGVDGWQRLAAILKAKQPELPLGAIAGITSENLYSLFQAGCDGIAVISAIFRQQDVKAATSRLAEATLAAAQGSANL